jgi:hypothetical protein
VAQSSPEPLLELLARYDRLVEVGIGHNTDLAVALAARGVAVIATDVVPREVPKGVEFVRDDVTDPDRAIYEDAEAIYAQRLPPELQRPTWELARSVGVPLYFTTLGGDPAVVPAETRTIPSGTVFVATRK